MKRIQNFQTCKSYHRKSYSYIPKMLEDQSKEQENDLLVNKRVTRSLEKTVRNDETFAAPQIPQQENNNISCKNHEANKSTVVDLDELFSSKESTKDTTRGPLLNSLVDQNNKLLSWYKSIIVPNQHSSSTNEQKSPELDFKTEMSNQETSHSNQDIRFSRFNNQVARGLMALMHQMTKEDDKDNQNFLETISDNSNDILEKSPIQRSKQTKLHNDISRKMIITIDDFNFLIKDNLSEIIKIQRYYDCFIKAIRHTNIEILNLISFEIIRGIPKNLQSLKLRNFCCEIINLIKPEQRKFLYNAIFSYVGDLIENLSNKSFLIHLVEVANLFEQEIIIEKISHLTEKFFLNSLGAKIISKIIITFNEERKVIIYYYILKNFFVLSSNQETAHVIRTAIGMLHSQHYVDKFIDAILFYFDSLVNSETGNRIIISGLFVSIFYI